MGLLAYNSKFQHLSLRQEDWHFEVGLNHEVRLCLNKQANKQTNKNNNNKKERGRKWRIRSALPKLSMHRQYRRTTEDQNTPRTVRLWREEAKANKPGSLQAQLSVLCIFTRTQETPAPCAATLGRLFFHFSTNALWVMAPSA